MVCLSRSYHFKIFKGYLPPILLGPFLNTLTQMFDSVLNALLLKSRYEEESEIPLFKSGPHST